MKILQRVVVEIEDFDSMKKEEDFLNLCLVKRKERKLVTCIPQLGDIQISIKAVFHYAWIDL